MREAAYAEALKRVRDRLAALRARLTPLKRRGVSGKIRACDVGA